MNRFRSRVGFFALVVLVTGCETPSPHTISRNYSVREGMPVDPPRETTEEYDDCAAGGQLYKMYCGSCHNARPLGERPLSNYHVALTHMRDQAYLTGKEYRQLLYFMRRWHDTGVPTPPAEPSPKRAVFPQPIAELRGESAPASPPVPSTEPGPFQVRDGEGGAPVPSPDAAGAPAARPLPPALPAPAN